MLILVLNCGGATLKFKLLRFPEEAVVASGQVDRLGTAQSTIRYQRADREAITVFERVPDHRVGVEHALGLLTDAEHGVLQSCAELDAVAHKLAHGGPHYHRAVRIDEAVVRTLTEFSALVPLHNPPNLRGIEVVRSLLPEVPQFGSFETSFHHTVPLHARVYGLPWQWQEQLYLLRYGFHSASHRFVAQRFPSGRVICCHLGSGTSVCAIREGKSLDISSGLTPQSGTVMSTRPGDFDPFAVTYVQRELGLTVEEVEDTLTRKSGLLGISGVSGDMRDLESAKQQGHERAGLAIAAFCYQVRRFIGAFYVELGGLDTLVFTGGIGERSASIRRRICTPLAHLGVHLDTIANNSCSGDGNINAADSRVAVHVVVTDEELMVARDAYALMVS